MSNTNNLVINTLNLIEDEDGKRLTTASGTSNGNLFTDADSSILSNLLKFNLPSVTNGSDDLIYTLPTSVQVGNRTFSIANNCDGTFSLNKAQFQYLGAGQAITLPINVTVDDCGKIATGTTFVTIIGTNDGPCANDDYAGCVFNNQLTTINILANDYDADANDTKTISINSLKIDGLTIASNQINNYITIVNNQIVFNSDLVNASFETPSNVIIDYKLTDSAGASDNANVFLCVKGNISGFNAMNQTFVDDEDARDNTGATAGGYTDQDAGIPNTLKFTVTNYYSAVPVTLTYPASVVGDNGKTYTITNSGNSTFTLNKSQFQSLTQGEKVELNFNYTINNGNSSDFATIKVVVIGTNDGPCLSSFTRSEDEDGLASVAPNSTLQEGKLLFGFPTTNFDAEGDTFNYRIKTGNYTNDGVTYNITQTGANTFKVTVGGNSYDFTLHNNGTFEFQTSQFQSLNEGQVQTVKFLYDALDSNGKASNLASATIKIFGTGGCSCECDTPTLVASAQTFIDDEDAIDNTGATSGAFTDQDSGTPGSLQFTINNFTYTGTSTVTISGVPSSITVAGKTYTITNNGNGVFTLDKAQFQDLDSGERVELTFNYTVTADSLTSTAQAKVVIIGTDDNSCPVVQDIIVQDDEDGLTSVTPNDSITANKLIFEMAGSDADGDTLTYAIKTGTFTSGGQTYTIANTSTAGTYTLTNNGQTFTLKDIGGGKFELLTSEFQYLNSGQIRTLKFQYEASSGAETQTQTINVSSTLTGVAGNQTWGDLKLSAFSWDGASALATLGTKGIGIAGGRFNTEIDFKNGSTTGESEKLVIEFPKEVSSTTLTLNYFYTGEQGNYEVAVWKSFDANGNLLQQGTLNAGSGVNLGSGSYSYNINFSTNAVKLELSAAPYSGSVITGNNDNSDYAVGAVQYTTVEDCISNAATATVLIHGTNDNLPPVVQWVHYYDDEDGNEAFAPNDTEVANNLVFSFVGSDPNGDALTYNIQTGTYTHPGGLAPYTVTATSTPNVFNVAYNGKNYLVTNLGNGKFQYQTSDFQYLNAGQQVFIALKYTATDTGGLTSGTNWAKVTIYGINDDSLVASNQQFVEDEDGVNNTGATATLSGTNYTDLDQNNGTANNGPLQFTINNFTYNGSGSVAISGVPATVVGSDGNTYNITNNGNGTFTLDKAQFQALSIGEAVSLTFNYTATAGSLTSTAVAKVIIIGTNDGLDAVDDNAGTINDGESVTLNILANDTDTDGDDLDVSSINSLVINGTTIPASQYSQYFTINNETGQLVFNSANMNVPAGTTQNVVINYTATDGNGATDSANVFVSVRGENLNLIASNQQFVEDEDGVNNTGLTGVTSSVTYSDLDDGNSENTLQFTINNFSYNGTDTVSFSGVPTTIVGSDGKTYNVTNNGNGTFTLDKSQFQSIPVGSAVALAFSYTIAAGSLTSSAQAKVIIIGANDAPDAVNDNIGTIKEGTTKLIDVLPNDSDPDGDVINVTRITKIVIDGVEYTNPSDIANFVTLLPNNQLFLDTTDINKSADYNIVITYEITDPYGLKDTADVFVNVDNVDNVVYYGDAQNDSLIVTSANAIANNTVTITSNTISGTTKNYVTNTVVLDDAEAYGDLKNLTIKATAGNATATATAFSTGGTEFGLAQTDAAISNNTINFGDDVVTVNRGEIVGDVAKLLIEGVQGNATANFALDCFNPFAKATANVDINNNTFNFGDDTLTAIKANIYGDVKNLEFKYTNGSTSGNGTFQDDDNWNFGNKFHFGNDVIASQEGLLVGDIASVTVNGTTYDLSVASQLAAFKTTSAYTANTFTFGSDTFVFDVSSPVDAAIADFGINGVADKLNISGLLDVNGGGLTISDLTDVSSIVNESGHISLNINLAGVESSISFLNIAFDATKLEITDYLNSADIFLSA